MKYDELEQIVKDSFKNEFLTNRFSLPVTLRMLAIEIFLENIIVSEQVEDIIKHQLKFSKKSGRFDLDPEG